MPVHYDSKGSPISFLWPWAEVDQWAAATPRAALNAMQELLLARRMLVRLPDPAAFHGVRVLKLSRNRLTHLPEALGANMLCLERLELGGRASHTFPFSASSAPSIDLSCVGWDKTAKV